MKNNGMLRVSNSEFKTSEVVINYYIIIYSDLKLDKTCVTSNCDTAYNTNRTETQCWTIIAILLCLTAVCYRCVIVVSARINTEEFFFLTLHLNINIIYTIYKFRPENGRSPPLVSSRFNIVCYGKFTNRSHNIILYIRYQ